MKCKSSIYLSLLFLVACSIGKRTQYDFPAAMLPHVKEANRLRCDQGAVLYKMNCAPCHNMKKGRKEIIPDFAEEALKGYALRISNAKHEANMPDSLVSEEELGIIMTFLKYRKKSRLPANL